MNQNINELFSDSYRVLQIIYKNQVTVGGETYCPLSQENIAIELGVTRITVNGIIKKLKNNNLLQTESRKYILTETALKFIKKIEEFEESFSYEFSKGDKIDRFNR